MTVLDALAETAIEKCESILNLLTEVPEEVKAANKFFADVERRTRSIKAWIDEKRFVTSKQARILDKWEDAVRNWQSWETPRMATPKQKVHILRLALRKFFWEHKPKDITDPEVAAAVERRYHVNLDNMTAEDASRVINSLDRATSIRPR